VRWGLHLEGRIHALHPAEPHLYVYVLGVHPSQKGRGLGGALLRHVAGIAKAAGVVAHLETSNPDNLGLYRRFGYEVQAEVTSHGGPPVWTMTTAKA
jgi:ribosomal protein S18 acetylase RimI-like enzyme